MNTWYWRDSRFAEDDGALVETNGIAEVVVGYAATREDADAQIEEFEIQQAEDERSKR